MRTMWTYAPIFGACVGALGGYSYAMYNDWLMLYSPLWVLCLFITSCCGVGAVIGSRLAPEEVGQW